MAAMETDVEKCISDTTLPALPRIEHYSRIISVYEQLVDLSQGLSYIKHANHLMQLRKYQKLKLREELNDQVEQLQAANNKKGLCIAYQSLMKTYSDSAPELKAVQEKLAQVEKAIVQETRDDKIKDLRDSVVNASALPYPNPAQRLISMANVTLTLADAYKEDERYTKEHAAEMRRAKNLSLQAAAFAEYKECKANLDARLK